MPTLNPQGRSHRVLAYLERGPARMCDIRQTANLTTGKGGRKAGYLMDSLIRFGFVGMTGDRYEITREGRETLASLTRGIAVEVDDLELAA